MGARKHIKAEARKEALKSQYFAKLKGLPLLLHVKCAMLLTWFVEWKLIVPLAC